MSSKVFIVTNAKEVKRAVENSITAMKYRVGEKGRIKTEWQIKKYGSQEDYDNDVHYSADEAYRLFNGKQVVKQPFNLLTNAGITAMLTLMCSTGSTKYDNANAFLGVGDSSTAEVATQTGLQATTNKLFKAMDATYPQISGQSVIFQSTFAAGEANFAFNEFGVANGSGGTVLLNRKVSAQGTKVSGQVWIVQLTITLS